MKSSLGHEPNAAEWAIFSSLWSEHCSYKSSKIHLKKFFFPHPSVLQSFGENAGVFDLGQGEKIAFKMESHNHPSFIEPYQGAATGVGGILRDIFTMGARPIALANYLCFGEPKAPRMKSLVDGVVRGIGGYGNCVGVPTVTGQTEFHSSYNNNILVNALALGYFGKEDPIVTSKAKKAGDWVVYVGAKTGRDGVHGASMASQSFDEASAKNRPTVQIGDPFLEKLLIESCIEVIQKNLVEAIQDMGAAGLTSSSFEMSAKAGFGFKLDLSKVPLRDASMTPEDILLSESQERMLLVCSPDKFAAIKSHFEHWNLDAEVIGEVLDQKEMEIHWRGECLTKMNPALVVDDAPLYRREYNPWISKLQDSQVGISNSATPSVGGEKSQLLSALKNHLGGSRAWIFNQYDQRVGGKTVRSCDESVGVVRLPESGRALGLVLGARPYVMRLDAGFGGRDALAHPALELAAKGFQPLALTDCLNYGNPQKPAIMSEFVASVESLAEFAKSLNAPVISGNVSLYNETSDQNITSTPSTGVVGIRQELNSIPTSYFQGAGQDVYLVSFSSAVTNGMWCEILNLKPEGAWIDKNQSVENLARFAGKVCALSRTPPVQASRVVGKFGLAYALARMTLNGVGLKVQSSAHLNAWDEIFYQIVFAIQDRIQFEKDLAEVFGTLGKGPVSWQHIGMTGGESLNWNGDWSVNVQEIQNAYEGDLFEKLA